MNNVSFLTFEQVIVIHDDQIEKYGGSHGLRDLMPLESAIMRPQSSFGEDLYPTLFEKCAALKHSLVVNHAFVDGNKRTAIVSGIIFLELNNYKLSIKQEKLVETALSLGSGAMDIDSLAKWLKDNSRKIS